MSEVKEPIKGFWEAFRENEKRLINELRSKKTFDKIVVPLESSPKETKPKGKKWKMRKTPDWRRVRVWSI